MFANKVDCAICGRMGDAEGVLDGVAEMNSAQNSAQTAFGFILGPSRDDVFKVFRRSPTFSEKIYSNSNQLITFLKFNDHSNFLMKIIPQIQMFIDNLGYDFFCVPLPHFSYRPPHFLAPPFLLRSTCTSLHKDLAPF
jgi:hypothetical protein